jgi:hypothetical protein
MTPENLLDAKCRRPFEEFRLMLVTGEKYDVRHPELIMVGQRSIIIGLNDDPARTVFQRTIRVDIAHIAGIEAGGPLNGSAA